MHDPFTDLLTTLENTAGMNALLDCNHALQDVVEAVEAHGQKGALRLDLTFKAEGDEVEVGYKIDVKLPRPPTRTRTLYPHRGHLYRDHPGQLGLFDGEDEGADPHPGPRPVGEEEYAEETA